MKYPPPEPPGGKTKARGAWSKSTVSDLLRNPKYTGHQVFNRRASRSRRGAYNEPAKWVWSPEPVHEPLIPKWMFDAMNERRTARKGSRDGNQPNTHPATRHTYVLRGMVFCPCGRRMFGNARRHSTYYLCWPRGNNRGRDDTLATHPKAEYINERALLDAVADFYSMRVFGPDRRELFETALAGVDQRVSREREAKRERLQRTLADLARRQNNVLRQAQDCEPGDPFTAGLRQTYHELDTQRTVALDTIAELDKADAVEPARPSLADAALLEGLPYLAVNLRDAPEQLQRRLFEITNLTIRLHTGSDHATITAQVPANHLKIIAETAERITKTMPSTPNAPAQQGAPECVDAVRAPNKAVYEPELAGQRLASHGETRSCEGPA